MSGQERNVETGDFRAVLEKADPQYSVCIGKIPSEWSKSDLKSKLSGLGLHVGGITLAAAENGQRAVVEFHQPSGISWRQNSCLVHLRNCIPKSHLAGMNQALGSGDLFEAQGMVVCLTTVSLFSAFLGQLCASLDSM